MRASLARLTAVLGCLALVVLSVLPEPGHGLKCSCNVNSSITLCTGGVCELRVGRRGDHNEDLYPHCAAIRHPIRGDYLACAYSSQREITRKCTAEFIAADNATMERCWCNNGDFCNQDLLPPLEQDDYEDEEESTTESQISSTAIISKVITAAETTIRPVTEESTVTQPMTSTSARSNAVADSTTSPLHDPGFHFSTTTEPESSEGSDEINDSTTRHAVDTDQAYQDEAGDKTRANAGIEESQEEESNEAETYDASIDTERVSTPSTMNEIARGVMTKDTHSSVSVSLRTDYLKPATADEAVRNGAMSSGRCDGGDCNGKRGPTSNNAQTVGSCGNTFLRFFILSIPAIAALLNA